MTRHAFRMRIRPELLAEYLARHETVWPEMLRALSEAGWRDYTLFHDGEGTVFGYLVSDDFDASLNAVAGTDVGGRWATEMQRYFEPGPPVGADRLVEYFHLE